MAKSGSQLPLRDSKDPTLYLTTPTSKELEAVYRLSFSEWGNSLTQDEFIEENKYLAQVPLAQNDGMESWILTIKDLERNERPILASCETFRKRTFLVDTEARFSEKLVYGIASVFVDLAHRQHGYGRMLLQELAQMLPERHVNGLRTVGSILYSDIGREYYTKLGWLASLHNDHLELKSSSETKPSDIVDIQREDIDSLCQDDEAMSRNLTRNQILGRSKMMIVPTADHMLWHISKEEFSCHKIFGKFPKVKGAMAGKKGNRVWAIWARRYYGHPSTSTDESVLYILRFVLETSQPQPDEMEAQALGVKAVIEAAQSEAGEWGIAGVKLWHPTPMVLQLIDRAGLQYEHVNRQSDSIASLQWWGDGPTSGDEPEWIACERYAWV